MGELFSYVNGLPHESQCPWQLEKKKNRTLEACSNLFVEPTFRLPCDVDKHPQQTNGDDMPFFRFDSMLMTSNTKN